MPTSFPEIYVRFFENVPAEDYRDAANRILNALGTFVNVDIENMLDLKNGRRPRGGRTVLKCWERGPETDRVVRSLNDCPAVEIAEPELNIRTSNYRPDKRLSVR
jgi:hypothetical protein